jgi:hypothetical protein
LVFLRYSSHFQATGFSLVRNQGKSLNLNFWVFVLIVVFSV